MDMKTQKEKIYFKNLNLNKLKYYLLASITSSFFLNENISP